MVADEYGFARRVRVDRETRSLRLLLEAHDADGDAVARAVRRALAPDGRGAPWRVRPLFVTPDGDAPDPDLARFFEATGAVGSHRFDQVAWELSYLLLDTGLFASVQPDLATGSYQLDDERGFLSLLGDGEGFAGAAETDLPETDPPNFGWALDKISVPEAWRIAPPPGGRARGEGVVIGHPDTGYTLHPQLGAAALDLERDWDFVSDPDDREALDPLERSWVPLLSFPGHGTRTGSVIAGRGEGRLTGVAPLATLLPLRTIRTVIEVREGDVAKAIHYAVANGAHIVSISFGGLPFAGVKAAIDHAVGKGVIVLAAAGNYVPFRPVVWPARYANCIAVAATDARDRPWDGSSRGGAIAMAAPGTGVWVASWNLDGPEPVADGLARSRGTSHAVAHVAGVAALWLAHRGRDELRARYGPKLSAAFRQLVATTSRRPDPWEPGEWGPGVIDAAALLRADPPDVGTVDRTGMEAVGDDGEASVGALFPPEVAERVERRLGSLWSAGARDASDRRALVGSLGRYDTELLYLLLENPDVRSRLAAEGAPEALAEPPDAGLRVALRRAASPSLLRELGLL